MPNDNHMMTAGQVRAYFGGISDMCIWRWLHDPKLDFPKPIYIRRLRYWKASEIAAFAEGRQKAAA